jgi:hypothetical protein
MLRCGEERREERVSMWLRGEKYRGGRNRRGRGEQRRKRGCMGTSEGMSIVSELPYRTSGGQTFDSSSHTYMNMFELW